MEKTIDLTLKVWRQRDRKAKGQFETYNVKGISTDSSFLEMLDVLNEQLINEGKEPVVFRPRLPRGYLRYVLIVHQWSPSWSRLGYHNLPIAHA